MKAVERLLDDLSAEMRRTLKFAGVDAVHDLRVSVRRATEGVRIFDREISGARRLRKELKAIRDKAAAVRDRDVTRQLLRRYRLPAPDPACIYLQGQRDLAALQLQDYLRRQIKNDHAARWRRWMGADE